MRLRILLIRRLKGSNQSPYKYLTRQLEWIRDERRKNANPAMLVQIKDMDNKTLSAIADYISRIKVKTQSAKKGGGASTHLKKAAK